MGIPDLLERAQEGDVDAFAEFYDRFAPGLLRWFARRTAASDVAADLCAETFSAALTSLGAYRPRQSTPPQAWLYGIAHNQFRQWLRHRRVEARARTVLGVYVPLPEADDLDLVELRADLESRLGPLSEAIDGLSDPVRSAVLLRVVDRLPYSTIASRLGCSEGAARVRVSRGLSRLLDQLGTDGD